MLSDYRRKNIYERWKSKDYLSHIGRLQTIMSKTNSLGRLGKGRQRTSNQPFTHPIDIHFHSRKLDESQSRGQLLPNLLRNHQPEGQRRSPVKQQPPPAELSILREKLLHVNSEYRRDKYEKNYKTTLRLLHNLRRKPLTSPKVNLHKLYTDSQFLSRCFPGRSYTHLCRNHSGKLFDQLFLKFQRLPTGWNKYDLFSIQKVCGKPARKKRKPMLFSWTELQKDLFLFRLPYRDESRLHIQINRFTGNDSLPLGSFVVWRGRNEVCTITSRGGFDLGEFRCIAELLRVEKEVSTDGRNIIQEEEPSSCCSNENLPNKQSAMFLAGLEALSNHHRDTSSSGYSDPFEPQTDR